MRLSLPSKAITTNILLGILLLLTGAFAEYRYSVVPQLYNALPYTRSIGVDEGAPYRAAPLGNTDSPQDLSEVDFSVFWEVWQTLERNYIEPEKIVTQNMVDGAISGMVASLGDPYTAYLPAKDFERTGQDLNGTFYGVGIELGYREGVLAVVAPIEGAPAEQAGVQAGDLIVRVKDEQKGLDEDSSQWSLNKAVEEIRGPLGSPVILTLLREGAEAPIEVTIERNEIVVESVELEFVEHQGQRVAHLRLMRFGGHTQEEWDAIVGKILIEQPSLDGIVLDMRNNPGGLFDGAIDVASEFIPQGVVVTQKGRYSERSFSATGNARLNRLPIAVLVNKGSASASEIVAGALRDQLGSILVGQQTFGKGTVQDRLDVSGGGGLHVTVARWMLPGGEWIHDEGIPVDVEAEDDPETEEDEMLLRAIEAL